MNKRDKKLEQYKARYTAFTRAAYANQNLKNSLLFAFLSVNTAYETNARAFTAMKDKEWLDPEETMHELMKHGIHYAGARAKYICEAYTKLQTRPDLFLWDRQNETIQEYRARLVKSIKGLSWIKVSFFISILYGEQADVCCLDRWMLRALGEDSVDEAMRKIGRFGPLPRKRYEAYEARLRRKAKKLGLSLCAYQWGIWDIIQHEHLSETAFPDEPKFKSNPMKALWAER